ncbi:hypothetical protein ACIPYS_21155 [Kitasatospora sp. NPDC089913]|uniref:hypothetical protein n=1 Tax=Kitasatospora sp. NPDC089913 TaxID=3364080 RepID=UPI00381AF36B
MTVNLDRLLAAKEGGLDSELLVVLDDADRAGLLDRALTAGGPDRVRAMTLLARLDPGPDGPLARAVGLALEEGDPDPFVVAAAVSLAACLGNDAVPVVQAVAASGDPVVALAAWQTLQQIAKSESLDALSALAPPPGDVVGDQAAFALSVIAYRAGSTGFELAPPDETELRAIEQNEQAVTVISTTPPTAVDFELLTRLTHGELYLMSPEPSATLAIDCGGDHMLLCIDPDIQSSLPDTLFQGPALAGLVALLDEDGPSYSVRYLALTAADGSDGVHVLLCTPGGAPVYYGHPDGGEIADGTVTFPLFAVERPGVGPIALSVVSTTAGTSLVGDLLAMEEIATDRLVPDPDS